MSDSQLYVGPREGPQLGVALGKLLRKAYVRGEAPVTVLYGKGESKEEVSSIFAAMDAVVRKANTAYLGFAAHGAGSERRDSWTAVRTVLSREEREIDVVTTLAVSFSPEYLQRDPGTLLGIIHQTKERGIPLVVMVPGASREQVDTLATLVEQGGHAYIELGGYSFSNLPQWHRSTAASIMAVASMVNNKRKITWVGKMKDRLKLRTQTTLTEKAGPATISPEILQKMLKSRDRNLRIFAMDLLADPSAVSTGDKGPVGGENNHLREPEGAGNQLISKLKETLLEKEEQKKTGRGR